MRQYALRLVRLTDGDGLPSVEEALLLARVGANLEVPVSYRDGRIDCTEDAIEILAKT